MTIKNYISAKEAAKKADVTSETIRRWCEEHCIGKKIGGRWRINVGKLRLMLEEGNPKK